MNGDSRRKAEKSISGNYSNQDGKESLEKRSWAFLTAVSEPSVTSNDVSHSQLRTG